LEALDEIKCNPLKTHLPKRLILSRNAKIEQNIMISNRIMMVRRNLIRGVQRLRETRRLAQEQALEVSDHVLTEFSITGILRLHRCFPEAGI
jgi:uncharacterized protein YhbP (UPF0306 family)